MTQKVPRCLVLKDKLQHHKNLGFNNNTFNKNNNKLTLQREKKNSFKYIYILISNFTKQCFYQNKLLYYDFIQIIQTKIVSRSIQLFPFNRGTFPFQYRHTALSRRHTLSHNGSRPSLMSQNKQKGPVLLTSRPATKVFIRQLFMSKFYQLPGLKHLLEPMSNICIVMLYVDVLIVNWATCLS